MPTTQPTAKQQQILDFIADYIQQWGSAPKYDEIANAIGVTNRGTVLNHLRALEARGLVKWNAGEARSIQLMEAK